jgi:DNA-binding transcriptional regulator YdaS (Cro superfamily)
MRPNPEEVGRLIGQYLEQSGTTQADFARQCEVTPALVWQWIAGYRLIAPHRALLAEAASLGRLSRYALRPDIYPPDRRTTRKGRAA